MSAMAIVVLGVTKINQSANQILERYSVGEEALLLARTIVYFALPFINQGNRLSRACLQSGPGLKLINNIEQIYTNLAKVFVPLNLSLWSHEYREYTVLA